METNDVLETLKNSDSVVSLQSQVSLQSHEDFINSLSTTHTLLLDMAAALRAVTQKEAQELGEVAMAAQALVMPWVNLSESSGHPSYQLQLRLARSLLMLLFVIHYPPSPLG